ncbi:MAG: tripartite tricarboxylate transporter substrate binding protein [Proteobacteria bacterium]|nr:tripartite tricarboxylate transporter substrate binding protein [Pseudomonadota bacterium]
MFVFILLAGLTLVASAQTYPSKAVKLVVPYPPGGPTDVAARLISGRLAANLKQGFVVENRPGASGNIGNAAVAKAEPDGHTILLTVDTTLTANPSLFPEVGYDPKKDLKLVSLLVTFEQIVVAHTGVGARSIQELFALARQSSYAYASGGGGSAAHLTTEALLQRAGVRMMHVPYKGNAPAVTAVVAGEVPIGVLATTAVLPLMKAGKMKALAVSGLKRSALVPDVPTIAESGYPDFSAEFGILLAMPARTPDHVVNALYSEVARVLQEDEVRNALRNMGLEVTALNPEDTRRRVDAETKRWSGVISSAGIRQD